jgi:hypothetical protein
VPQRVEGTVHEVRTFDGSPPGIVSLGALQERSALAIAKHESRP